jgi:hypothetical protein
LTNGLLARFGDEAELGLAQLIRHFVIVQQDKPMRTVTRQ